MGVHTPDLSDPALWDARYLSGEIPWDTGIVPPEVVALVTSSVVSRGWAFDLGCGSGVTSRYLAACGFRVIGVDLAQVALGRAHAIASPQGRSSYYIRASVADLGFVRIQASLAVDIGCFHTLSPSGRASYIRSLADHLSPGAHYLLYAFVRLNPSGDTQAVSPVDVAAFAPEFKLQSAAHGLDRERPSAWFLMRRAS